MERKYKSFLVQCNTKQHTTLPAPLLISSSPPLRKYIMKLAGKRTSHYASLRSLPTCIPSVSVCKWRDNAVVWKRSRWVVAQRQQMLPRERLPAVIRGRRVRPVEFFFPLLAGPRRERPRGGKCAAKMGRAERERKKTKNGSSTPCGTREVCACVGEGGAASVKTEPGKKKNQAGRWGVIQSSFSSFRRLPSLGAAAAVFTLVPYLEETVPGASGHCHTIFGDAQATYTVVVTSQDTCTFSLHRVPNIAVKIVIAGQEQAA